MKGGERWGRGRQQIGSVFVIKEEHVEEGGNRGRGGMTCFN